MDDFVIEIEDALNTLNSQSKIGVNLDNYQDSELISVGMELQRTAAACTISISLDGNASFELKKWESLKYKRSEREGAKNELTEFMDNTFKTDVTIVYAEPKLRVRKSKVKYIQVVLD